MWDVSTRTYAFQGVSEMFEVDAVATQLVRIRNLLRVHSTRKEENESGHPDEEQATGNVRMQ